MNWEAITAISTLLATLIILVTVLFAIMQLNEMKRSRKLDVFMQLFNDYSSPRARENRRFIYNELPEDPSQLTDEHFLIIDDVLAGIDRAWLLIELNQIEAEFVIDTYGEVFLKLWDKLHPIVFSERELRGDYYRKRAEAMVELINIEYDKMNRPKTYKAYSFSDDDRNENNTEEDFVEP